MPDEIKAVVDNWTPFSNQLGTMVLGGAMKTIYEKDLGLYWVTRTPIDNKPKADEK